MTEAAAGKRRRRTVRNALIATRNDQTWLFRCQLCGEPITFQEPLVPWTQCHQVKVAHARCIALQGESS